MHFFASPIPPAIGKVATMQITLSYKCYKRWYLKILWSTKSSTASVEQSHLQKWAALVAAQKVGAEVFTTSEGHKYVKIGLTQSAHFWPGTENALGCPKCKFISIPQDIFHSLTVGLHQCICLDFQGTFFVWSILIQKRHQLFLRRQLNDVVQIFHGLVQKQGLPNSWLNSAWHVVMWQSHSCLHVYTWLLEKWDHGQEVILVGTHVMYDSHGLLRCHWLIAAETWAKRSASM